MQERSHTQPPGTPTWADITTTDTEAAAAFFTELLGWEVNEANLDLGGYRVAMAQKMAAGAFSEPMQPDPEQPDPEQLDSQKADPEQSDDDSADETLVYLACEDAAATLAKVTELGGSVEFDAHEVSGLGTMAVAVDPQGNRFGLWQAGSLGGFSATDGEGLPTWFEVRATDLDAAAAFYGELFGLEFGEQSVMGRRYLLNNAFGITDEEAGWEVYYWVDDLAAAVEKATGLGATVTMEPASFEFGSSADLRSPGGARFGLFQPADEGDCPLDEDGQEPAAG